MGRQGAGAAPEAAGHGRGQTTYPLAPTQRRPPKTDTPRWGFRGLKLLRGRLPFTSVHVPSEFYNLNLSTCRIRRLRSSSDGVKNSLVNGGCRPRDLAGPKEKNRRDEPGGKLTGRHNKERIRIRPTMGHPRAGAPNRQ